MPNKSKKGAGASWSQLNLGRGRKDRIEKYRAKRLMAGQKITSIEEAVNILIDVALEAEAIPQ